MKTALISGATSGIGKATAILLAKNNYRIIACGRRAQRLSELKGEIEKHSDFLSLNFDIRDKEAVFSAIQSLPNEWQEIDLLINNAGNAHGLDPIDQGNIDDWDAMIDINVKGLLYLTKAVLPKMPHHKNAQIINIGSIAGKEVYPNGNVYCASKHAVDALNKGMRMDLFTKGIRVSAINPGLVETEFSLVRFKGDEKRAGTVYQGYQALLADDIAETVLFICNRPPHVNIAEMTVFPSAQASSTLVHKSNH